MTDYNRKLSNERETQDPSHRMSILVLLETIIFLKIVSVSVMLFYVVSNTTTGPDSKLKLTAIGILNHLYTYGFSFWFETINFGRSIVYIKWSQFIIPY